MAHWTTGMQRQTTTETANARKKWISDQHSIQKIIIRYQLMETTNDLDSIAHRNSTILRGESIQGRASYQLKKSILSHNGSPLHGAHTSSNPAEGDEKDSDGEKDSLLRRVSAAGGSTVLPRARARARAAAKGALKFFFLRGHGSSSLPPEILYTDNEIEETAQEGASLHILLILLPIIIIVNYKVSRPYKIILKYSLLTLIIIIIDF
jgi:hypothetical protein